MDMFDEAKLKDKLARQRIIDMEYIKAGGTPPSSLGTSVGGQPESPQKSLPELQAESAAMKKRAEIVAKTQAEAKAGLPQVEQDAKYLLSVLDRIVAPKKGGDGEPLRDKQGRLVPGDEHPGLEDMVGMPAYGGLTTMIPWVGGPTRGTDAANFGTMLNQVKGKQFMQAYQSLKGGGQITEVEGQKAEQALARMDTAQTEKAFREATLEFRDEVLRMAGIARQRSGVGGPDNSGSGPLTPEEKAELEALRKGFKR